MIMGSTTELRCGDEWCKKRVQGKADAQHAEIMQMGNQESGCRASRSGSTGGSCGSPDHGCSRQTLRMMAMMMMKHGGGGTGGRQW